LILSFLIYLAQADWFEDQFDPYPCPLRRVRRAWGDLTDDQKTLYARVVFQLWLHKDYWLIQDTSKTYSLYYTIAAMHGELRNGMLHKTSAFPKQHKAFLWIYESAVIYTALVEGPYMDPPVTEEEACSITLPYWEWDLAYTKNENGTGNWNKITESDVFREPAVFGDCTPELTSGFVDSGYFSPLTTDYGKDVSKPLKRSYIFKNLPLKFDLAGNFNNKTTFAQFIPKIHLELHSLIHTWVSGWMSSTGSAGYDPLFYLHHCNNDRLWNIWVDCRGWEFLGMYDLTETQYKAMNPISGSYPEYSPDTKIPWLVGLDDKLNFYVTAGVTAIFLPESDWPTLRELWSTGTDAKRGWNGLYYRYGPDKLVRSNTLICPDNVWSLVNQEY